jgi:hypothetical protein
MKLNSIRRREVWVLSGLAALYFLLWLLLPKPAFWGLDSGIKFQGCKAFATTGSIAVPYQGADFDPKGEFRPILYPFSEMLGDQQVPVFSPLFMVMGGALLWLLGGIGPFLLPLFGGWICLFAGWLLWSHHRKEHDGTLFLILLGLGSPILFYSLSLWEHSLAVALVTLSFYLVDSGRRFHFITQSVRLLAAGVLMGFAVGLRSETLLWPLVIFIFWRYTGYSWHQIGRFYIGLSVSLFLVATINYWQTENILPLHISSNIAIQDFNGIDDFLKSRLVNAYHATVKGFKSAGWSVFSVIPLIFLAVWSGWRKERFWWIFIFIAVLFAWGKFISTALMQKNEIAYTMHTCGILWTAPVIALALNPFRGERRKFWRLIWWCGATYLAVAIISAPSMLGVHWGPRLLLEMFPFLMFYAATRIQRWWERFPAIKPLLVLLITISILNQAYSYKLLYQETNYNAELNRWAAKTSAEPTMTALWWLAGDCSLVSDREPWFLADRSDRIRAVIGGMRENGVQRISFYEWGDDKNPYISDKFWWESGVEPLGADYFLERDGLLRRRWLKVIH